MLSEPLNGDRPRMIVCICNNVNEHRVRLAIADGAVSGRDVHARLGVQTGCGRCLDWVDDMIAAERARA